MTRTEPSVNMLKKVVVELFLLALLVVLNIALAEYATPFQRGFFCGDESLMFPFKTETVSSHLLKIYCTVVPYFFIILCEWTLLRRESADVKWLSFSVPAWLRGVYCAGVSFGFGLIFTDFFTNVAKMVIGRPRPFFFDVCKPSVDCSAPEWQGRYILPEEYFCMGDMTGMFRDMRMSFLSGHSSMSAFAMIYLALYLDSRMTWRSSRVPRHVIQFVVVMLSWFTALSRVSDFRHHWSDVLAGYSLGTAMAFLVWTRATVLIDTSKLRKQVPQAEITQLSV